MTHRCIFLLSWIVISPLTPPNPFSNRNKKTQPTKQQETKPSARKSTKNTNYCKSIGSLNLQSCCYTVTTVVLVLWFSGQTLRKHEPKEFFLSILSILRQSNLPVQVLFSWWQGTNAPVTLQTYRPLLFQLLLDCIEGCLIILPSSETPPLHHCHGRQIFHLSNE